MLTNEDIEWMKANRSEIIARRTEPVTLVKTTTETDPYTNEPIETGKPTKLIVQATWEEVSAVATIKDFVIEYPTGVELRRDNVLVAFDASVDVNNYDYLERKGVRYDFLSINEKGIGDINRYECVVRRTV
jgi:hypothetical protein